MKKPFVLNFWRALLIVLAIDVVAFLFFFVLRLFYEDVVASEPKTIFLYFISILTALSAFGLAKKTDTDIKELYTLPNWQTLLWMVMVLLIAKVIFDPLAQGLRFFRELQSGYLRLLGEFFTTNFSFDRY